MFRKWTRQGQIRREKRAEKRESYRAAERRAYHRRAGVRASPSPKQSRILVRPRGDSRSTTRKGRRVASDERRLAIKVSGVSRAAASCCCSRLELSSPARCTKEGFAEQLAASATASQRKQRHQVTVYRKYQNEVDSLLRVFWWRRHSAVCVCLGKQLFLTPSLILHWRQRSNQRAIVRCYAVVFACVA